MKIPSKKLNSGFEIPTYGLGLWRVGGDYRKDESNDSESISAIEKAIKKGITHIDTAELYGDGHAEELLGQAIKNFNRRKLFIASKTGHDGELTYDRVMKSFEGSLKRIGTDYLDLYYLHLYPKPGLPVSQPIKALNELVDQGLVKNIAVSNFTPERFKEAQECSKHNLVCNQVHYNVQYREVEDRGVLRYCQKNDVMLVAWRPLQKAALPESDLVNKLARKYGKTTIQIELNWLISQQNVVVIAKTSQLEHLDENLGALGWKMDSEDIEKIRNEFPDQKLVSDAVPLDWIPE